MVSFLHSIFWIQQAYEIVKLVFSNVMPLMVNKASIWASQSSGFVGQKSGSFIPTAVSVGV